MNHEFELNWFTKTNKVMKKKSLLKLIVVVAVVFCASVQLRAQEIEVTDSDVFIRSENSYGVLKFYDDGELLLNRSASSSSYGFTINVSSSSVKAFCVKTNWSYPFAFTVYGNGDVYANGLALTSDSTAKEDIQIMDSQIDNLKKLKGVSYKWKDKEQKGDKESYGLLAQDLEKVFPDMVFRGDSGQMGIYYIELIPVLLDVAQEQQALIEEQAKQLLDIEKRLAKLEKGNNK